MLKNLVFLPATPPGDPQYGTSPERFDRYPDVACHHVRFASQVWYNAAVCDQAATQIAALGLDTFGLVGFSKSGLGAWNLTLAMPDRVAVTIIFDAPVTGDHWPHPSAAEFYPDDAAWQQDLPLRRIAEFRAVVPASHRLILVSGKCFHDEMCRFSQVLREAGVAHEFLSQPQRPHHWQSGWIEEVLSFAGASPVTPAVPPTSLNG